MTATGQERVFNRSPIAYDGVPPKAEVLSDKTVTIKLPVAGVTAVCCHYTLHPRTLSAIELKKPNARGRQQGQMTNSSTVDQVRAALAGFVAGDTTLSELEVVLGAALQSGLWTPALMAE